MKKSFMTRVLAMGLSLAMAFSMSAAINVTTASAAASPMGKSSVTMKVGAERKIALTETAKAKYRIKKAIPTPNAKKYLSVITEDGKKAITITANKKMSQKLQDKGGVKIAVKLFKKGDAKKKVVKTANVYVVVKAKKVVEEAYKIVSAEPTKAKEITVTLNKAVADATKVTATVKRGTTTKDSTFTVDGTKIVITTDTKLIAGTYNVSIGGVAEASLDTPVEVAKDETLTSYKISEDLIPDFAQATSGAIYYQALNQYDEPMTADVPEVSCSFTSEKPEVAVAATATREGKIEIKKINESLAILGTKGTIVLVDKNTGTNATATVTYSSPATAAEVKVDGLYNTAKSAFQDITAHDKADEYFLLMTITDQYGHQLDWDAIKKDVSVTLAGGITNVECDTTVNADPGDNTIVAKGLKDVKIAGKEYIAVVLKNPTGKITQSGSATLTMVNNKRGLLLTHTLTVVDYVILSNFVVNADNGIYEDEYNELSFEATDTNGKSITDYATMDKLVTLPNNQWKWQKNADGSAKLVYKPTGHSFGSSASHTGSTIVAAVFECNEKTSSNFKVKTQNFTIKQPREVVAVQGLAADAVTQFSTTTGKLSLSLNKIVYLDQYANKVANGEELYSGITVTDSSINTNTTAGTCGAVIVTTAGMTVATVSGDAFVFEAASNAKDATATVYLKYYNDVADKGTTSVSKDLYDYKFVVSCVDTGDVGTSSIKIKKINNGYTIKDSVGNDGASGYPQPAADKIDVVATVAGVETKLDPSQYFVKSVSNNHFSAEEVTKGIKTKTATLTLQVTTFDKDNNPIITEVSGDFQVSYDNPFAYEVNGADPVSTCAINALGTKANANNATASYAAITSGKIDKTDMQNMFNFKDQYGDPLAPGAADWSLSYSITPKETTNNSVKVYGEDNNRVWASCADGGRQLLEISVKTQNGKTTTKDIWVNFQP